MGRLGRGLTSETIKGLLATNNALMEMNNINNQRIANLDRELALVRRRLANIEIKLSGNDFAATWLDGDDI
ncbi:MAG TPA: hypothetical protein VIY48_13420 [Candidatus Paceibacterota bacterium]